MQLHACPSYNAPVVIYFSNDAGFSQLCYSERDCAGDTFAAATAKDCCVGTDEGLSFSADGVTCTVAQCIGKLSVSMCNYMYNYIYGDLCFR